MVRTLLLSMLLVISVLFTSDGLAKQPKVAVCHFDDLSEAWVLINIAAPAVRAHLRNHDDCVLEEGVEGCVTPSGVALDAECAVIVEEPEPEPE